MNALALLAALAAACFGWQLASDPARAGQALAYLLALVMAAIIKRSAGRDVLLSLVATFAIWAQSAGLACTAWYERLSSRTIGACDEGTGLPVLMFVAVGFLIVAAEFLAKRERAP